MQRFVWDQLFPFLCQLLVSTGLFGKPWSKSLMTCVLLVWTSDTINLLSHRHPLHCHDTVLTLLYFTEETRSPKTHRLLNTNGCYCRVRQKTGATSNPAWLESRAAWTALPGSTADRHIFVRGAMQQVPQHRISAREICFATSNIGVRKREKSFRTAS